MRIAIAGSSGLIGGELLRAFSQAGHTCICIARAGSAAAGRPGCVHWDPAHGRIDAAALEGCDAVINLAGANLGAQRWTPQVKRELLDSRVKATRLLSATLAGLTRPPAVLVNASAVGYYGDRPWAEELDENAVPGEGFLASLVQRWEEAAQPAASAGVRVVLARMGVVLSAAGGALAQMLPVFKLSLGGRLGSGKQVLSWIALPDVSGAFLFALEQAQLSGPLNLCAPHAVTNAQFTKTLARVLRRPAVAIVPAFALRLVLGEMAEMVLCGQRAVPQKLIAAGYRFRYPHLEAALEYALMSAHHGDG